MTPRTDSCYITDDMEQTAADMVRRTAAAFKFGADYDAQGCTPDIKRLINNEKVSDHHALLPTKEISRYDFTRLPEDCWNVLSLIAIRLLLAVDHSCYESAILDGANWFQRAYFITIPAIRPIIAPSVLITVFTTFKQFDVVYLLTQQAGAKTGANIHTILTYAYENAFITNNYGYSSAISILIFVILILFSMVTSRKAKEG